MSDKHTQGPWIEHDDSTIRDKKGFIVAKINTLVDTARVHEVVANSQLITAAPDLLKALEDLIQSSVTSASVPKTNQAKKAIAKAKGEE